MNGLKVTRVVRDPSEMLGVPNEVADIHEVLPPPHRFPNFLVDFEYNGVPGATTMALELEGRDVDCDNPPAINPDDMADFTEDVMNAIYESKPYADASKSLEQAPASFWQ